MGKEKRQGVNGSGVGFGRGLTCTAMGFNGVPVVAVVGKCLLVFCAGVYKLDPTTYTALFLVTEVLSKLGSPLIKFIVSRYPGAGFKRFHPALVMKAVLYDTGFLVL